jgi:HEAT repeat protein
VHGQPVVVAVQGLSHGRAPVRAAAGSWLAQLGDPTALPELERALSREEAPSARAALSESSRQLSALAATSDVEDCVN